VPLLPRWSLGNWWSRYWAYSAGELLALMDEFKDHQVPLSVCIVDMDWHLTETGNTCSGWTGYTWNRELFPDPPAFIAELHARGLRTALNLHPAEGVHPHETQYGAMAGRLGVDPASGQPLRFDIADPEFTRAYFELLHHPLEAQGVDFWWIDWQQGTLSGLPGLDPLYWLNHLHFYDLGRDGSKRPFIFSRWGGLGNHRYPIGFSGDTVVTWDSLAFQSYFSATAANVGYGWWSHDIGGHMGGIEGAELFTRWVQFGVFSPIQRMHCTKNPFHERRPWGYDAETERLTRRALQLRHALIPYLYSMSWRDHRQALPLVRPMYHSHPKQESAYHCPDQYWFGSELVAAPFIQPQEAGTRLSRAVVWLPGEAEEGSAELWFDFFGGARYTPGWHALYGGLEDIPVFARAGAIVPLAPMTGWGGVENPAALEVHAFPGADNRFELFEDDGGEAYSLTPFQSAWNGDTWELQIGPATGSTAHLPAERSYRLLLRSIAPEATIAAQLNAAPLEVARQYNPDTSTLELSGISMGPTDRLQVKVSASEGDLLIPGDYRLAMCRRMLRAFPMDSWSKMILDEALPSILDEPEKLADFELALNKSQLCALLEVICSAGMQRQAGRSRLGEEIILWNNQDNPDVRYRFSAYTLGYAPVRRSGPLPVFAALKEAGDLLHFQSGDGGARRFSKVVDWYKTLTYRFTVAEGGDLSGVVQLDVRGPDGLQAYFLIQDGIALKRDGLHQAPHATLRAEAADFLALLNGEAAPMELYTSGKMQVEGNLELLLSFYQGLEFLPHESFQSDPWKLEVDYLGILRI
jgi:hypothetical protein